MEIAEERQEEMLRQQGRDRQTQRLQELSDRLQEMESEQASNLAAANILRQWITEGKVAQDENGNCHILSEEVEEPESFVREHIFSRRRPTQAANQSQNRYDEANMEDQQNEGGEQH